MVTLKKGQAPVNARQAQANATLQNSTVDTKGTRIGSNPNAATVESTVKTNVNPAFTSAADMQKQKEGTALADASHYVTSPTSNAQNVQKGLQGPALDAQGNLTEAGLTNERNTVYEDASQKARTNYNPDTGIASINPIDKRKAERQAKIDAININRTVQTGTDQNGNPIFGTVPDEAATQQAKDAEKNRQMQEDKAMTDAFNKHTSDAQTVGGNTSIPSKNLSSGSTKVEADPLEAAFQKVLANTTDPATKAALEYQHYSDQQEKKRKQDEQSQLAKDEESAKATALGDKQQAESDAAAQLKKDEEFAAKQDELNRVAVENAKIDAQNEMEKAKAQADLNGQIAYHNQSIQNDETEMQNRNMAAKLGINYDTGGMQYMMKEKQKGIDALNFISQQITLNDIGFAKDAVKITRDYTQNIFQASQYSVQQYNLVNKAYTDAKRTAKSDYSTVTNSLTQYYQTLKDKLSDDIYKIDKDQGTAISAAVKDMNARIDTQQQRADQKTQWTADYNYRVDSGNRDFEFQQAKWEQETKNKEAELVATGNKNALDQFYKDNDTRTNLLSDVRLSYHQDTFISSYDQTYVPTKAKWDSALQTYNSTKGDKSAALDALTKAFGLFTSGAQADGSNIPLLNNISLGVFGNKDKYTDADVPAMTDIINDTFDKAKERRDGKLEGLRSQIDIGNAAIANPQFHVTDSQAGLPYTPPSKNQLNDLMSMPANVRMQEKTMPIGGTSYTGPNEMLTRMKVADDAYFEDYGKHLKFTNTKTADGYSISVDAESADDAYNYMVGAGLQDEDSSPDNLGSFYQGKVTQGFDTPISDKAHGGLYESSTVLAWGGKHDGLDIAMPVGTPLQAPLSGTIVEAGKQPGWGNTIVIQTADGALIRYSHLSEIGVKKGDTVGKGLMFAKSGNTGNSTGPHLDLRVKKNGKYIDPRTYSLS